MLKEFGAFGSGMGMEKTSSSVTGAFMIIGLKHGKTKADDCVAGERLTHYYFISA